MAFVNTLSGRETPAPNERLTSYEALVEWARAEGV
ncbi:MAG: ABATE domain-containing protein, partial [Vicinamibacterales bacterium]